MPCGVAGQYFVPGKTNHINCAAGSEGRFVTITPTEKHQTLSLNEVQVYGEEGKHKSNVDTLNCLGKFSNKD